MTAPTGFFTLMSAFVAAGVSLARNDRGRAQTAHPTKTFPASATSRASKQRWRARA